MTRKMRDMIRSILVVVFALAFMIGFAWALEYGQMIASSQTLTGSWANLGAPIPVKGQRFIQINYCVTHNNSTDVQFKFLTKSADNSQNLTLPITTVGSSSALVEPLVVQENVDTDACYPMVVDLFRTNFETLQVQVVATPGATPGAVTFAEFVRSRE